MPPRSAATRGTHAALDEVRIVLVVRTATRPHCGEQWPCCVYRPLAESGADVNAITDIRGRTPMNSARYHGAAVRALLSLGAAVDWHECVTVPGLIFRNTLPTALHWAVEHGSADAVEALIKAGADLEHDNASRRLVLASEDEATRRAGLEEAGFDVDEIDDICDEINEVADESDGHHRGRYD